MPPTQQRSDGGRRARSATRADAPEPVRSHSRANRRALMRAVADLLAERGVAFSLVDVAERAGTSVATSYRHLVSQEKAIETFHHELWREWTSLQEQAVRDAAPSDQLAAVCRTWVTFWLEWGSAAVVVRPIRGIIERHREGNEDIERIWAVLSGVIDRMIEAGEIPPQSIEYGVVMWLTLLNERVVLDLHRAGWSARRIADSLTTSLMAVLKSPPG